MAAYTFPAAVVLIEATGELAIGATGVLRAESGGAAVQVYDLNGSPIPSVVVGSKGAHQAFEADIPTGVLDFGSTQLTAVSLEAISAALAVEGAVVAAEAAAESAADDAAAAAASAASSAPLVHTHTVADISATGTPDGTTFLSGDGSWKVVVGGGGGGAVDSVNGETGVVVLSPADVGAATAAQGLLADSAIQAVDLAEVATSGDYNDLINKPSSNVTVAQLPPGATLVVRKDPTTGFWPASYATNGAPVYTGGSASSGVRPTSRTDVTVAWKGPGSSPGIVASGTGGMLDNVDTRLITP